MVVAASMPKRRFTSSAIGTDYFDRIDDAKAAQRLVRRLHDLGYSLQLWVA